LHTPTGVTDFSPTRASASAPPLTQRIERQLAESGLQVTVEDTDGSLLLSGVVDTAEAREAATEIAGNLAPGRRIDNQLEVETVLPPDMDDFFGDEAQAELPETLEELAEDGGEAEPDFTDQPTLRDPVAAPGASSSEPDDPASSGQVVYEPPSDPVVTTDVRGEASVLGGFGTEAQEPQAVPVEPSAEDARPGDEALADAIRQELREDAATTDLQILVAVRRGVAHLRGQVSGAEDAENAEAVASRVPGIRDVVDEIDVANL
jgi:osmotically-inducible protein OsmY